MKVLAGDLGSNGWSEVRVTTSDTRLPGVTSPYSITQQNKCNTSYFFAVSAENVDGETAPGSTLGFSPSSSNCVP